jgi:AcrR family transcriptional regulator
VKTKERILEKALHLFNEAGTSAISTNHIAEAAGISPGNLYYHFRNKEEIIRALCNQLFTTTGEMFIPDHPPTLADVREWVRQNFIVTWQYAFVYRELPALLRQDAELATDYARVRERGYDGFHMLIRALQASGVLVSDIDPKTMTQLADLCWLITESWLTALDLQGQPATHDNMQRGIDLMLLIFQPYLGDRE